MLSLAAAVGLSRSASARAGASPAATSPSPPRCSGPLHRLAGLRARLGPTGRPRRPARDGLPHNPGQYRVRFALWRGHPHGSKAGGVEPEGPSTGLGTDETSLPCDLPLGSQCRLRSIQAAQDGPIRRVQVVQRRPRGRCPESAHSGAPVTHRVPEFRGSSGDTILSFSGLGMVSPELAQLPGTPEEPSVIIQSPVPING